MKRKITWEEVLGRLSKYDHSPKIIYGVPKGGMIACSFLKEASTTHIVSEATLILDDLVDSGATKAKYKEMCPKIPFVGLFDKVKEGITDWLIFPWESDHPMGEDNVQQNIIRMIQYIGEDVNREGLLDTPNRIVRSWDELFSGYKKKPGELMTIFAKDTYDEMVLCKDIELYSTCEHHWLPFFGKAHVAYIPDKHVIGISKLARLVDVYSRRLQIQERIGEQVAQALMEYLQPKGAACIIEATHMCMKSRGVNKQNSTMVTSSLKGVFLTKPAARQELLQLIKG
jgi:GTP cyclohydrolase I